MKITKNPATINEILEGIEKYFSHYWGFIQAENPEKVTNKKPDWKTITKFKLDPETLLKRFLDEKTLVGIRFATNKGSLTRYLMIDLDRLGDLDPRINPKNFIKLIQSAEEAGLAGSFLTSSSWNNGMHLWFGLSEGIPVFDASCLLQKIIENAGFKPKEGSIEAFPNCKSWAPKKIINYKGHRLPLQPNSGSFLLDDDLNPISSNILHFFRALDWSAEKNQVDKELLEKIRMAKEAIYYERISKGKSGKSQIAQWKSDLEFFQEIGWNDFSQTNNLLCKIATYGVVFKGLEKEELVKYTLETATSAPGYLEYCRHQHNIEKRCQERARNAEKYYWALGEIPKRSGTYKELFLDRNDVSTDPHPKSIEATQYRITETVNYLWKNSSVKLPHTIRLYRQLLIKTIRQRHGLGASERTLTKYPQLWHPKHLNLNLPPKPEQEINEIEKKTKSLNQQQKTAQNLKVTKNQDVCHQEPNDNILTPDPWENQDVCHLPYMKVLRRDNLLILDPHLKQTETLENEEIKITGKNCKNKNIKITISPTSKSNKNITASKIDVSPEKRLIVSNELEKNNKVIAFSELILTKNQDLELTQKDSLFYINQCFTPEVFNSLDFVQESRRSDFKTSEEKLKITKLIIKKTFTLTSFASGLVIFKDLVKIKRKNGFITKKVEKMEIKTIPSNSTVIVLDEYHSSSLSDNTNPIFVYVKPVGNKDWKTGLAVQLDSLKPCQKPEK